MVKLSGESSGNGGTCSNLMWWLGLTVDFGQAPPPGSHRVTEVNQSAMWD